MTKEEIEMALIKDGYQHTPLLNETVSRLYNLTGKSRLLLEDWLSNGQKPSFAPIEGITVEYLRDKLEMKDAAIILAYAMLLEEPKENSAYFLKLGNKRIIFNPKINQNL